jgi:hypothetical protein
MLLPWEATMRGRAVFFVLTGAIAAVIAFPSAASAAEADGCSGSFTSKDASGATIDTASAPGAGATQSSPFQIDANGTVDWSGSTDAVIKNGTWSVTVAGLPLRSGSFENAAGESSRSGTQDLSLLPAWALQGAMAIPVSGTITGTGGSCTASGWITVAGSPTSSPIFFAGAGLGLVGLIMGATMFASTKVVAGGAAAAGGLS